MFRWLSREIEIEREREEEREIWCNCSRNSNEIHLQLMMSLFFVLRFADVNGTAPTAGSLFHSISFAQCEFFFFALENTLKRSITRIECKMRCFVSSHFHAIGSLDLEIACVLKCPLFKCMFSHSAHTPHTKSVVPKHSLSDS